MAFFQKPDPAQAAIIRSCYSSKCLVGLAGASIQRDLDGKRRPLGEVVGNLLSDNRAIREERNKESLLLCVGVDLQKILASKDFTARVENPETTHLRQLIEQVKMFFLRQLAPPGIQVSHWKIVVAVQALQRTAAGHFNGHL